MSEIAFSIIIPCFNHGQYLIEAVESYNKASYPFLFETIIINDGSTDLKTLEVLDQLEKEGILVIHTENGGPSKARNIGISQCKGKYILPLDSDNLAKPDFLLKSFQIMENEQEISIVFSDCEVWDKEKYLRKVPFPQLEEIVLHSRLDTCAVYRKAVWNDVGGYDEFLSKKGLEDWEFWMSAFSKGFKFYHIPEPLYVYRIFNQSRTFQVANKNIDSILDHVYKKHWPLLLKAYKQVYAQNKDIKLTKEFKLGSFLLSPIRKILSKKSIIP
jgi:glycosyltransferase involved in cell wall biosynthesis